MLSKEKQKWYRTVARRAGLLYLLTFISIPTLTLYAAAKKSGYLTESGFDSVAATGGVLELIMALACIGTAVVLYPVLKKQNKTLALGLVSSRILEAAVIFVGVAVIFTLIALRQADLTVDMEAVGQAFAVLYDKLFLVSQSLLPAVNNLLLGALLYSSRLIPRGITLIGLVGAPLLILGFIGMAFGGIEQGGSWAGLAALLVAVFECTVGVWLLVKGFSKKAVERLEKIDKTSVS